MDETCRCFAHFATQRLGCRQFFGIKEDPIEKATCYTYLKDSEEIFFTLRNFFMRCLCQHNDRERHLLCDECHKVLFEKCLFGVMQTTPHLIYKVGYVCHVAYSLFMIFMTCPCEGISHFKDSLTI